MAVRAIRGATTCEVDGAPEICAATGELLARLLELNNLQLSQVISLWLTVTPDLRSEFPARGARDAGWGSVPMLCAVEIDVPGAVSRCIRAMAHVEVDAEHRLTPAYLRGAKELRPDQIR
jgi:chorismate mutase